MRFILPALVAAAALIVPASGAAHATLLATSPENGAVLDTPPTQVTVTFDDTIRVGSNNAVVANASRASALSGPAVAHGRTLVLPLEPHLADGAYTARWSIVSDDGHREEGVIAFAVGAGSAPPQAVLGAAVPLTWSEVLFRTFYYLGLLAAAGAAFFGLLTRRTLGDRATKPLAQLLFFALLLAFIGGSEIAHTAPSGTRYDLVVKVALVVSFAGGAAAALTPAVPRLLTLATACALALLVAPTLSGHALDPGQPRVLSVAADLGHIAAASAWLGGLLALVYVVPRAAEDGARRSAAARTFSRTALIAVLVLGATGLTRAVTELNAVSQVWTTSYGRTLIVKTALFLPLLGVGWFNRTRLLGLFGKLRRSASAEIVVIAGIVVAVAILTELRPGVDVPRALAAPVASQPPVLPPPSAVVDARELGSLAVAVAREPRSAIVTLLSQDGTGVDGRAVRIDGAPATSCGAGCYRAAARPSGTLDVSVDGAALSFGIPSHAPDAAAALARVTRAYRSSRSIVFEERLASSPTDTETTRFTVVAPNRLAYQTVGGASAIVIGGKRWDRDKPGARWQPSPQTPLDVTQPYWTSPTNVHLVAPHTFTFLDRSIPAWFRLTVKNGRPSMQHMTAAAHFMVDRYLGFDTSVSISPPAR